jgi:hypothetical protein
MSTDPSPNGVWTPGSGPRAEFNKAANEIPTPLAALARWKTCQLTDKEDGPVDLGTLEAMRVWISQAANLELYDTQ